MAPRLRLVPLAQQGQRAWDRRTSASWVHVWATGHSLAPTPRRRWPRRAASLIHSVRTRFASRRRQTNATDVVGASLHAGFERLQLPGLPLGAPPSSTASERSRRRLWEASACRYWRPPGHRRIAVAVSAADQRRRLRPPARGGVRDRVRAQVLRTCSTSAGCAGATGSSTDRPSPRSPATGPVKRTTDESAPRARPPNRA